MIGYKLSINKIGDTYELKSFIVENGLSFSELQSKDIIEIKEKAKRIINSWIDMGCTFEYLAFLNS